MSFIMPVIHVIDSSAQSRTVNFEEGDNLMELLRDSDFEEIAALCGGVCSCATCHVHITSDQSVLVEKEEDETELLELADDFDETLSRLSCQIELSAEHDGLEVTLIDNA